jgi:integration host factor subunit beta
VTKRELVIDVAERLGYTQNEVSDVVQGTLDAIVQLLAEGQRLEIRNFGVFEVKKRDARIGRNPRTGEEVPIEAKRVGSFKPGKALKEIVQNPPPKQEPQQVTSFGQPTPSQESGGEHGGQSQGSSF